MKSKSLVVAFFVVSNQNPNLSIYGPHELIELLTNFSHSLLYLSIPIFKISILLFTPNYFSIISSIGSPWLSPKISTLEYLPFND